MIAATPLNRLYRLHSTFGNLLSKFSRRTVMNDCQLAQDTFLFRQVICIFNSSINS